MSLATGPILVVEDIAAVRELIEAQLRMQGYQVHCARDGLEALACVEAAKPAVILTDILMPRLDGFALAHRLRQNPATRSIPIIFLSATYVSAEDERFALDLGARRFLAKPMDADDLFAAVADALTSPGEAGEGLTDEAFCSGYLDRLEAKLRHKAAQVARYREHMETVDDGQRATYQRLLDEAEAQYAEIQHEVDVLRQVMQGMA